MSNKYFFEILDGLDNIIDKASKHGYEKAILNITPYLQDDVVKRYFYSKLDNPEWLTPLAKNGFFNSPYQVEIHGNYTRHLMWPESQFLENMANRDSVTVANIITEIPDTDNERIHENFVSAASKMPVEQAVMIAKCEIDWTRKQKQFHFLYHDYFSRLISYLSKNSKSEMAHELLHELLRVDKQIREIGEPNSESYHQSIDVVARFSAWDYEKIVKECIPDLIDPEDKSIYTLKMLSALLNNALEMEYGDKEPPNDYSWIWRRSIEDHEQNHGGAKEFNSILISAIRDTALIYMKHNPNITSTILIYLESMPWLIFKRIALYLLSIYPEHNKVLLGQKLTNKEIFMDSGYRNEYAHIAKAGFIYLDEHQKSIIMKWIKDGPEIDRFKVMYKEETGNESSVEQIQKRIEYWQRDRLNQFKESLPIKWKQIYKNLVKETGEPEHPEFSSYSTSWSGPTSPKNTTELQSMTVAEIVDYLINWQPPNDDMDHSTEGLSRILADVVASEATRFAEEAETFKGTDPIYVRGLLEGFRNISENHAGFPWRPVLSLCYWVVNQPRDIPGRKSEYDDLDPGWVWVRKRIASLLTNNLKKGDGEIPFNYREQVWSILNLLTIDPQPTPEDEHNEEGYVNDPVSLSINTVRGEAMHALIEYGLWIYRHCDQDIKNFDIAPELRESLEWHLNKNNDPSLAIRSIYGQKFPWINLMDSEWSDKYKLKIFNDNEPKLRDAAWIAYITFCQPYDDVFLILKNEYFNAINRLGESSIIQLGLDDEDKRLAEHLFSFYWRGKIQLDDKLIKRFYEIASTQIAASVIEFLGRGLRNYHEVLTKDIETRLIKLWEWRVQEAEKNSNPDELSNFSWWVASGKLDAEWTLTQYIYVLKLPVKLESISFAAEQLVKLVSIEPSKVLTCLNLMVDKLDMDGVYFRWNDEAKSILTDTVQSGDPLLKEQSIEIIHKLGAHGYLEYRELLKL